MGNDFGASPLLFKGALCQVRGPHILAMTRGHLEMIETGLGIILQTPARLREGGLIVCQEGLLAALAFLKRRRIARRSATNALKMGQACGGTFSCRFCIL